jgi:hypothetical protein
MIKRNDKEDFLYALETWMNGVVAKNADGHNELIPDMVKDGFQQSMKANSDYHADMAERLEADGDKTLSQYHCLMADIYKTFMCK